MTRAPGPRYYFVAVPFLGRGTTDAAPTRERTVDGLTFPRARLGAAKPDLAAAAHAGFDGDCAVRLLLRSGLADAGEGEAAGGAQGGRRHGERGQRRQRQRSPSPYGKGPGPGKVRRD